MTPALMDILRSSRLWLVICAVAAFAVAHAEPAQAAEYDLLENRPDRLIVELPNRLIVIVQELHTAPVVSAQIWVKTGSIFEQEHVGAGLSHFLEHLLAGGTTTRQSEEKSNEILGQIGARMNAATSLDTVQYYINTTSPHVDQAIELISDWMRHNIIAQTEYERERDVIQKEFAMGRGEPGRILWKLTQQARYTTHPARHPTIGYLDEFLKVSRDEIRDFYHRMYVPNNMVFVVVGDVQRQKIVDRIAELWQDADAAKLPKITFPREKPIDHPVELSATAAIHAPRLRLAWRGTRLAGEGDYALDLLAGILGQGESSRLVRTVRDQQRKVNTISAYNASFNWGEGFFGIDAEIVVDPRRATQPGDLHSAIEVSMDQAKAAILEQVARVRNELVSGEELNRARRQTLARIIYSSQSAQGLAARLARDVITTGDPDYLMRYAQSLETITPEQIREAGRKFLDPSKLITITLLPQSPGAAPPELKRPELAKRDSVLEDRYQLDNAALGKQLRNAIAKRYEGSSRPDAIVVEPPRRLVLRNGLQVIIGRTTVVPAVSIQFYQLGGLLSDPLGAEGVASAMAQMRMRGTTTRTAQEIHRQIESLGAEMSSSAGNNSTFVQAMCLSEDWPTILDLVQDIVLHPAFPKDEWLRLRPRLVAAIRRQEDNWHGELIRRFRETFFGEHPWASTPLGRVQAVDQLTAEDLKLFHQDHLSAEESVLAIFGDVDVEQVQKRVKALFEAMPRQPLFPFTALPPHPPTKHLVLLHTDKPLGAAQIGFGPTTARTDGEYPAMQVLTKVLSSFPSGRLEHALRGREGGLVYAVGAGQSTGLVPGYFAVLYNSDPTQVSKALLEAMKVIRRLRKQEVDEATLERAKASVLTERFLGEQTNSDLAGHAALVQLYGLSHDERDRFIDAVNHVTTEHLLETAKQYLVNPVAVVISNQDLSQEQLKPALEGFEEKTPSKQ